jgi:hypothetical protein
MRLRGDVPRTKSALKRSDLKAAADGLLAGLGKMSLARRARANDAFEFFLWAHSVHEAGKVATARSWGPVLLRDTRPGGKVCLRISPGQVTGGPFTFAAMSRPSSPVEIHTGLFATSLSGADHEIDVIAINAGALAASATQVTADEVRWGIEAKLYRAGKSLTLQIPRSVLGSAYDMRLVGAWCAGGPRMALATTAALSVNGRRLFLYPSGRRRLDVEESIGLPAAMTSLDRFVNAHASRL